MIRHLEIIDEINERYVLLKRGWHYRIIDKNNGTMVLINDPVINYKMLIKIMIEKGVEIYHSYKELPEPTEKPIEISEYIKNGKLNKESVRTVNLIIKKIYSPNERETGSIISAMTNSHVDLESKRVLEQKIRNYAHSKLYPHQGLNIYSDIHSDTVSLVIIIKTNELPYDVLPPIEDIMIDW
jgi:hypothetical protein